MLAAVSEGEIVSEAVAPVSVEVNEKSVAITFDGTASLVNCQKMIETEVGLIFMVWWIVTLNETNMIVNGEEVGMSETTGESAVLSGVGDE